MKLIVYYVAIVTVADLGTVALCYLIEQMVPWLSLPIFLFLFFAILWAAWLIAVRLTEPKIAPADGAASDQRA